MQTLILDTNVLISSLVRAEGVTRTSLAILFHQEDQKVLVPVEVVEELTAHVKVISRKVGISDHLVETAIEQLLSRVIPVPASAYRNRLSEALQYVRDESDAPLVALALTRSPSILLTYNKRHFLTRGLARHGVRALTPVEALQLLTTSGNH